jgi:hypothetical protein
MPTAPRAFHRKPRVPFGGRHLTHLDSIASGPQDQNYFPAAQVIRAEPVGVNAVIDQGINQVPLNSNIGPKNAATGQILVRSAGTVTIANPTAGDGSAAEFDVAVSGSSPLWIVTVTWLGAGLAALPLGKTTRTITITSAGATNSPLAVPVAITAV